MATVTRSRPAREDLIDIWTFIAQDNPAEADRYLDRLEEKFISLAGSPGIGRLRPEIGPNVRGFVVGSHLVLYRKAPGGVQIVRVIHGARDLGKIALPDD